MKKLFFETIVLVLILVFPIPVMAMGRVEVGVSIPMPPAIVFAAPPHLVVMPGTYAYVVPDIDVDIFFYSGWWWRPWQGRWYRSLDYHSGWNHYQDVPSFYGHVPPGWRNDYKQHRWKGHQWNHQPISHQQVKQNWNKWEKDKHWEKQNTWGVQDMNPRKDSRQQNGKVEQKSRNQGEPQYTQPKQEQSDRGKHDRKQSDRGKHNKN